MCKSIALLTFALIIGVGITACSLVVLIMSLIGQITFPGAPVLFIGATLIGAGIVITAFRKA